MADVIRVLVVDDDPLVRVGLTLVLGAGADIEVVGEAADGSAALAAVRTARPDVVLMDIRMPGLDGLAATEALRSAESGEQATPAVIVLTTFDTDEHVLRALRGGASGFLLKDTPPTDILTAVRRVAAGESILSPTVLARLIDRVVRVDDDRAARARARLDRLSPRERDVALAVASGKSNVDIGAELFMSTATVKAYVSRLLTKMECVNRVQVAILVHEADLPAS
jgi:DNA-binding NarL/FixJ family response regulator